MSTYTEKRDKKLRELGLLKDTPKDKPLPQFEHGYTQEVKGIYKMAANNDFVVDSIHIKFRDPFISLEKCVEKAIIEAVSSKNLRRCILFEFDFYDNYGIPIGIDEDSVLEEIMAEYYLVRRLVEENLIIGKDLKERYGHNTLLREMVGPTGTKLTEQEINRHVGDIKSLPYLNGLLDIPKDITEWIDWYST